MTAINKFAAVLLGIVWTCIAGTGLWAAIYSGRWLFGVVVVFALFYAVTWLRVAAQGRQLSWREAFTPWRVRGP